MHRAIRDAASNAVAMVARALPLPVAQRHEASRDPGQPDSPQERPTLSLPAPTRSVAASERTEPPSAAAPSQPVTPITDAEPEESEGESVARDELVVSAEISENEEGISLAVLLSALATTDDVESPPIPPVVTLRTAAADSDAETDCSSEGGGSLPIPMPIPAIPPALSTQYVFTDSESEDDTPSDESVLPAAVPTNSEPVDDDQTVSEEEEHVAMPILRHRRLMYKDPEPTFCFADHSSVPSSIYHGPHRDALTAQVEALNEWLFSEQYETDPAVKDTPEQDRELGFPSLAARRETVRQLSDVVAQPCLSARLHAARSSLHHVPYDPTWWLLFRDLLVAARQADPNADLEIRAGTASAVEERNHFLRHVTWPSYFARPLHVSRGDANNEVLSAMANLALGCCRELLALLAANTHRSSVLDMLPVVIECLRYATLPSAEQERKDSLTPISTVVERVIHHCLTLRMVGLVPLHLHDVVFGVGSSLSQLSPHLRAPQRDRLFGQALLFSQCSLDAVEVTMDAKDGNCWCNHTVHIVSGVRDILRTIVTSGGTLNQVLPLLLSRADSWLRSTRALQHARATWFLAESIDTVIYEARTKTDTFTVSESVRQQALNFISEHRISQNPMARKAAFSVFRASTRQLRLPNGGPGPACPLTSDDDTIYRTFANDKCRRNRYSFAKAMSLDQQRKLLFEYLPQDMELIAPALSVDYTPFSPALAAYSEALAHAPASQTLDVLHHMLAECGLIYLDEPSVSLWYLGNGANAVDVMLADLNGSLPNRPVPGLKQLCAPVLPGLYDPFSDLCCHTARGRSGGWCNKAALPTDLEDWLGSGDRTSHRSPRASLLKALCNIVYSAST